MPVERKWGGTAVTDLPSMRISPELGVSKPAIMLRTVVLPQPLGPSRVKTSPRRIASSSSCTASTGPKLLLTRTSSTALAPLAWCSVAIDREHPAEAQILVGGEHEGCGGEDEEGRDRGDGRIAGFADVAVHGGG